jgi:hypothetical protein
MNAYLRQRMKQNHFKEYIVLMMMMHYNELLQLPLLFLSMLN